MHEASQNAIDRWEALNKIRLIVARYNGRMSIDTEADELYIEVAEEFTDECAEAVAEALWDMGCCDDEMDRECFTVH